MHVLKVTTPRVALPERCLRDDAEAHGEGPGPYGLVPHVSLQRLDMSSGAPRYASQRPLQGDDHNRVLNRLR